MCPTKWSAARANGKVWQSLGFYIHRLQRILSVRWACARLLTCTCIACASFLRKSFDYRHLRLAIVHALPTISQVYHRPTSTAYEFRAKGLHHNRIYFTPSDYLLIDIIADSMKYDLFLHTVSYSATDKHSAIHQMHRFQAHMLHLLTLK